MSSYKITTLNDFIILKQKDFPFAKGELSFLLHHIGTAAKMINKKINKAGLVDIIGQTGEVNIQGESQQKLDHYADEVFIDALFASGECCGVATEENQNEIVFTDKFARNGNYLVCIDPLDGSSNIDYNVSVGSIFSVYRRITPRGEKVKNEDFLQMEPLRWRQVMLFMVLQQCWSTPLVMVLTDSRSILQLVNSAFHTPISLVLKTVISIL